MKKENMALAQDPLTSQQPQGKTVTNHCKVYLQPSKKNICHLTNAIFSKIHHFIAIKTTEKTYLRRPVLSELAWNWFLSQLGDHLNSFVLRLNRPQQFVQDNPNCVQVSLRTQTQREHISKLGTQPLWQNEIEDDNDYAELRDTAASDSGTNERKLSNSK